MSDYSSFGAGREERQLSRVHPGESGKAIALDLRRQSPTLCLPNIPKDVAQRSTRYYRRRKRGAGAGNAGHGQEGRFDCQAAAAL